MTDLSKDALDALVTTMTRLADDMEKHATDEWDEHENVSAAIATITALRAENDRLRVALAQIDIGQSAEPDHWQFRCRAREIARAALQRKAGE